MKRPLDWALDWAMDPALFASDALGFEPDGNQTRVLQCQTKRGLLNCSRQWGKSTVTAILAVHRALFRPKSLVLTLGPCERQTGEWVEKAADFMRVLGMRVKSDGRNRTSLSFPNGSRIVGLPGKERFLRGFSAVSLMLIDEAARVEEDLYYACRPMLVVSNGDLWLMSTPFGKRGFFYNAWAGNDNERWTRFCCPATECARMRPEVLENERLVQGERKFRQEYLCEFVQTDEALFNEDLLRSLVKEEISPEVPREKWWL